MTSSFVPPEYFDLKWKAHGDRLRAPMPDPFWYAEQEISHFLQVPAGIDLDRSKEVIILDPATYDVLAGDAWFGRLTTYAEQRAAAELRQREIRHSYSGQGNVEGSAAAAAVARGWELYKEFGPAVRKVTPLLRLLELQYLYPNEVKRLEKMLGEIETSIAGMADEAAAVGIKPSEVVLDDEFVVKAVRLLTELDQDRNKLANRLGWGRETTAPGHWCCSLLKTDRQRAIEIGRGLVSHHLVQLKTLGLEPATVPSPIAPSSSPVNGF